MGLHMISLIKEIPEYGEYLRAIRKCSWNMTANLEERVEQCVRDGKDFAEMFDDVSLLVTTLCHYLTCFFRTHTISANDAVCEHAQKASSDVFVCVCVFFFFFRILTKKYYSIISHFQQPSNSNYFPCFSIALCLS